MEAVVKVQPCSTALEIIGYAYSTFWSISQQLRNVQCRVNGIDQGRGRQKKIRELHLGLPGQDQQ